MTSRKRLLVAQGAVEPGEILAGAFFDPGPPQIDGVLRASPAALRRSASRARSARAASASGASERSRALPSPRALQRASSPRREIGGHAFHRQRADGFHARLLGGFEDCRGIGGLRAILIVERIFVIGAAQRIGVALAAHDGDFRRRQIARGQRQARLEPFERRRLGAEIDFQLRLARERPHRAWRRRV